ncbi:MAG: LPS export ABC transporter permease LptG [Gluconacetobacter diazotrophicus]|nr:LPS export ABC transporter permease LptG [Gluconacetobacter diazotrophicus]
MIGAVDRYLAAVTLRALLFTALGLTALMTLFGFVAELALVGRGTFGTADALLCAALEVPARLLQVVPVSMLLACLLGLGGLARHSELVALRALGLGQVRIMLPALGLVLPVSLVLLLMSQFVIPGGEQAARQRRVAAVAGGGAGAAGEAFWARGETGNGTSFLEVGGFGDRRSAQRVAVYEFRADGTLRRALDADWAEIRPDGEWMLHGVERHVARGDQIDTDHLDTLAWRSFLSRRELRFLAAPPNSVPALGLLRHIRDLKRHGQSALRYQRELWARIAIPFSMAGLVLSAAPLLFGTPRGRTAGARLAAGIGIAIGFSLFGEIMNRLGVLLELAPAVQALTPPILLLALALWLLAQQQA